MAKNGKEKKATRNGPQLWGTVAQWASAVIALVGLTLIFVQVNTIRENALRSATSAKEQSARQIFTTYMNWGFQYPQFTTKPVRYEGFNSETRLRYEWFVLNFLFAYDEIFNANQNDQTWVVAFQYDLPSHLAFICAFENKNLIGQFDRFTQALVLDAARDAGMQSCNGRVVPPKK